MIKNVADSLRVCPFCGYLADIWITTAICSNCMAKVTGSTVTEAVSLWNKRHTEWIDVRVEKPEERSRVLVYRSDADLVAIDKMYEGRWFSEWPPSHWSPLLEGPTDAA